MAATTGRVVVALGAVAVVALLAGGADADCYDYCFKDCMARENNMVDYCSYACDKTCQPDDKPMVSSSRPLAAAAGGRLVGDMECQLSCALDSCHRLLPDGQSAVEACLGQCYDGCKTSAAMLPRPLRAGGAGVHAVAWPAKSPEVGVLAPPDDPDHYVFSSPPDDVDHDPDQVFASPPDDIDHHVFAAPPGDPDHA
uniref:Acidic protein n=1 Tax=Oryza punctata TaxID=4537 RepID=A0A0E0JKP3_ORYPU